MPGPRGNRPGPFEPQERGRCLAAQGRPRRRGRLLHEGRPPLPQGSCGRLERAQRLLSVQRPERLNKLPDATPHIQYFMPDQKLPSIHNLDHRIQDLVAVPGQD